MSHLLVTNDFPPKIGGIQSYLYELWRRLPPESTTVLTTAHADAEAFDAVQPFRIERTGESFLVPTPMLAKRIDALAAEVDARVVLLDPAWPLGAIGPLLERPFGVVLHGAEVTIPARLPFVQLLLRATMRKSRIVIAAGGYPAEQGAAAAGRPLETVVVPPGVDTDRFVPLVGEARTAARERFGMEPGTVVVSCISRLVPRKGVDHLIQATARLSEDYPSLRVVVGGEGRDRSRLEQMAAAMGAPVTFLGRVAEEDLPALYAASDVFAMVCRDRWMGLEQEGFGIVFLEAAATAVPAIAGRSGGSAEAVVDGTTGIVVDHPTDVDAIEDALASLLDDPGRRARLGAAGRERVVRSFGYDHLAATLQQALDQIEPYQPPHDPTKIEADASAITETAAETERADHLETSSGLGHVEPVGGALDG
jgi:phosphatidylinositol alpha-1,6-mannosyltransferase